MLRVRPVVLDAVGDVTTGEDVGATVSTLGSAYPWSRVGATLRAADITTANLEGVVSARGAAVANKEFHFRGSPALLHSARVSGGLDVVTVANNHSGDFGSVGLLDTIRFAHAAGIETVGGGANAAAALRPVVVTAGGLRVGFVGLSDVNPYGFNATADSPGTAKADPETVGAAVHAALRRSRRGRLLVPLGHGASRRAVAATAGARGGGARRGRSGRARGAPARLRQRSASPTRGTLVALDARELRLPVTLAEHRANGHPDVALDRTGVRGWRVEHATIHGFRPELDRGQ